jgi:hypothetical protein
MLAAGNEAIDLLELEVFASPCIINLEAKLTL